MNHTTSIRTRVALTIALLLALAVAFVPTFARATLPGSSGGIAFVAGAGAGAKVCVQQLDGTGQRCLDAAGASDVALQPIGGRWLLYVAPVNTGDALYAVDTEAASLSAKSILTPAGTLADPTWIDGSTIAYVYGGDVFTAQIGTDGNLAGSPVNRTNTPGAMESDPTFVPGYRIAYVKDGDLWTMGAQGQDQRCVKEAPGSRSCYLTAAAEQDLNFSLAGLYYAAEGNVYRLKLNKQGELTQAPVPVGATRSDERGPAPSPGGKELVFERAGELVHMKNATTTMDEAPLPTGFAQEGSADWGSVFELVNLNPDDVPNEQQPYDVEIEVHGTFVVLDFKTVLPDGDEFAMVTLEEAGTGYVAFAYPDSSTTVWQDVIVPNLTPGTDYTLQIHGLGKPYEHPDTVTTLKRHVTIAFQEVGGMEDDGDPGSCGDFRFRFHTIADSQLAWNMAPWDLDEEVTICDDEQPYTWNPQDVLVELDDVKTNTITVYVLGVDDDADCVVPLCNDYIDFDPPGWTDVKSLGEWAEEETPHNVGLDSDGNEEWTHSFTLEVQQGDGNPHFTWWYTISVSYS